MRLPPPVARCMRSGSIARAPSTAPMSTKHSENDLIFVSPRGRASHIVDQPRETLVHVILMMAMEEGGARIVGDKVDLSRRVSRHADCVLHQPRHRPVADFRHLEGVAMRVDRV